MSQLNALLADLRDRKLWPVAVALLAAIVAVPVLLSKSPAPASSHPVPSLALPVAATHSGPAVTVDATPVQAPVSGHARDPFVQQLVPTATKTAASTTGASSAGAALSSALTSLAKSSSSGSSTGSTGNTSNGTAPSTGTASPGATNTTPPPAPKPHPAGLTSKQVYDVALSIGDASGGFYPFDSATRLFVVPNSGMPLAVEYGVLQGGNQVLFALLPGTSASGPATCTPGPLYCQVISLAPGQTETLSSGTRSVRFQVTAISVVQFPSVALANKARAAVSATGKALLSSSIWTLSQLFDYEPAVGAVVDQLNLTVGGS
jgi:hypothetical protein